MNLEEYFNNSFNVVLDKELEKFLTKEKIEEIDEEILRENYINHN